MTLGGGKTYHGKKQTQEENSPMKNEHAQWLLGKLKMSDVLKVRRATFCYIFHFSKLECKLMFPCSLNYLRKRCAI